MTKKRNTLHLFEVPEGPPPAPEPTTNPLRPLRVIAQEIYREWNEPYFGAFPYIDAMSHLDSVTDRYWYNSGGDIVRYFLSNARTWRGPAARRIKAELHEHLKGDR